MDFTPLPLSINSELSSFFNAIEDEFTYQCHQMTTWMHQKEPTTPILSAFDRYLSQVVPYIDHPTQKAQTLSMMQKRLVEIKTYSMKRSLVPMHERRGFNDQLEKLNQVISDSIIQTETDPVEPAGESYRWDVLEPFRRVLTATNQTSPYFRDIIYLMLYGGLRIDELSSLTWSDIEIATEVCTLKVRDPHSATGNLCRKIYIPSRLIQNIRKWYPPQMETTVFYSPTSHRSLKRADIEEILRRVGVQSKNPLTETGIRFATRSLLLSVNIPSALIDSYLDLPGKRKYPPEILKSIFQRIQHSFNHTQVSPTPVGTP
jgi:integrase